MRNSTGAHARATTIGVLIPTLALALSGCQKDASNASAARVDQPAGTATAPKTLAADSDPCRWVSAAEVATKLGALSAAPWRASHAESPEADQKGHACVYPLAEHGKLASDSTHYWVAVELVTEAVPALDGGSQVISRKLSGLVDSETARQVMHTVSSDTGPGSGWDHALSLPNSFTGRLGGIAIQVASNFNMGMYRPNVPDDSVERLAALVRDRIPDIPIASPHASRFGSHGASGPDPCSLISRDEAEAVLGKLTVPPYRAASDDLADPGGGECGYYTGKHRVLTISPEWENGKTMFRISAGFSQGVSNAIGVSGQSADTLDGPWDQVGTDMSGSILYFLKGDRMLSIEYKTSTTDVAGALRLAKTALTHF